jgi:hypothetical protein
MSAMPPKSPLPRWIPPQLTQLVEIAPLGPQWVQEIKLDGWALLPCEDDVVHDRNAQTAVIAQERAQ